MTIRAQEASSSYEAVRHRLPPVSNRSLTSRQADTLANIADDFDLFLLDAFGVLNIGEPANPRIAHQIATIRAAGKPFTSIFDLAFARLDYTIDKSRTLMVGHSLHTDILGAQAAGIASALIANFGFFADQDSQEAIERAGIYPDFALIRP